MRSVDKLQSLNVKAVSAADPRCSRGYVPEDARER